MALLPPTGSLRLVAATTVLAAALFIVGGCENTIEPFSDRAAYSVYGALSLSPQKDFVRVKPLNTPIVTDTSRSLDVTVTLRNLADGSTTTLRDSTIVFGDGVITHNYWTDTRVAPNTEYRLTVEAEDGTVTEVTATTPTGTDPIFTPEQGDCLTSFTVVFRDAVAPYAASIGFRTDGQLFWADQQRSFALPGQSEQGITFIPETVLSSVIPSVDNPQTLFQYEPRCWELDSKDLRIAYTYLGPDWFGDAPEPGDTFDPTESSRVANGLGFFGALRRDTLAIPVDTSGTISTR